MNKTHVSRIILIAALMNTAFSIVLTQILKTREKEYRTLLFLDKTIEVLQENLHQQTGKRDPLISTEDILILFKKNGVTVGKYQILEKDTGERTGRVLLIRGKGNVSDVIALLHSMALSEGMFRIIYTSIKIDRRGNTVSLIMKVAYA